MNRKVAILLGFLMLVAGIWLRSPSRTGSAGGGTSTPATPRRLLAQVPASVDVSATSPANTAQAPAPKNHTKPENQNGSSLERTTQTVVNRQASYQSRSGAIKALVIGKNASELKSLYDFLREHNAEDEVQLGQVLKNELMDELSEQDAPGLQEVLTQVYEDHSQVDVLRDYALQHLIENFQLAVELSKLKPTDVQIKEMGRVLWAAANETDTSIAGTALLGLSRLSDKIPEFDRPRIIQVSAGMAADQQGGELTRITAMQILGRMEVKASLPVVMETARTGQSLPLRISAIGVLGQLGGPESKAFLTSIINGEEAVLKPAARQALNRLRDAS